MRTRSLHADSRIVAGPQLAVVSDILVGGLEGGFMRIGSWFALMLSGLVAVGIAVPANAAGVGVVLLHARNSFPTQFDGIVPRLAAAGYQTVAVNACWSDRRTYGATSAECQLDIDK